MEEMETMEALQEGTTPNEGEPSETAEAEQSTDAPQAEEGAEEQSESESTDSEQTDDNGADGYLMVTVNHEERALSRDEVKKYAQLGLQKEYLDPFIAKIDYLAAVQGVTREEYIDGQLKSQEDAMRQSIIDRFGNDESTVNEMLEFTKQKHKKAYDDMLARQKAEEKTAEETTEARLASEFAKLCEEFPELSEKGFKGLPKTVRQAGFGGENLLNAYLQYKHREAKNIAAAKAQAEAAAKKSTGSMGGDSGEHMTEDEKNFLKGLWG